MAPQWLLLSGLVGFALAQTKVVTVLVPPIADAIPDQTLFASVVSVNDKAAATEYVLDCRTDDTTDCVRLAGITLTYGPTTAAVHIEESTAQTLDDSTRFAAYTIDVACSLDNKENFATCSGQATTAHGSQTTTGTTISTTRDKVYGISAWKVPITVTAGAEKLTDTPEDGGDSSTGTSTKPTGTSTTPASSSATKTGSSQSSPTGSTTGQAQSGTSSGGSPSPSNVSSTSTGGVPRVTQQAVLAGVAAVVGGAFVL